MDSAGSFPRDRTRRYQRRGMPLVEPLRPAPLAPPQQAAARDPYEVHTARLAARQYRDVVKVVSIALFGQDAAGYAQGLRPFVRAHHNLFPVSEGWRLRIHLDATAAAGQIGTLVERYVQAGLCERAIFKPSPLCEAMLQRIRPAFDHDVDFAFSRDIDAAPMPRDRACCDQFMAMHFAVHTIHDATAHCGLMGGLSGFWAPVFRDMVEMTSFDDLIRFGSGLGVDWERHGVDQDVLNHLLRARPALTLLEHRYEGWHAGPEKFPPHPPEQYPCLSSSSPTPNGDGGPADRVGNHLGCKGYDYEGGVRFWDDHGDPEITRRVRECE